jgi:hypothetical protein
MGPLLSAVVCVIMERRQMRDKGRQEPAAK